MNGNAEAQTFGRSGPAGAVRLSRRDEAGLFPSKNILLCSDPQDRRKAGAAAITGSLLSNERTGSYGRRGNRAAGSVYLYIDIVEENICGVFTFYPNPVSSYKLKYDQR